MGRDYAQLLHITEQYSIHELTIRDDDWVAQRPLGELRLTDEGVLVFGVIREDGTYLGVPTRDTVLEPGDTVLAYGHDDARWRRCPSADVVAAGMKRTREASRRVRRGVSATARRTAPARASTAARRRTLTRGVAACCHLSSHFADSVTALRGTKRRTAHTGRAVEEELRDQLLREIEDLARSAPRA